MNLRCRDNLGVIYLDVFDYLLVLGVRVVKIVFGGVNVTTARHDYKHEKVEVNLVVTRGTTLVLLSH